MKIVVNAVAVFSDRFYAKKYLLKTISLTSDKSTQLGFFELQSFLIFFLYHLLKTRNAKMNLLQMHI